MCDIDGVLADFNNAWRDEQITRFGATIRPFEDGHSPDCWDYFQKYGATKEQCDAFWRYREMYPSWWESLALHNDMLSNDASDAFYDLHETEDVYYVTSRPANARRATSQWFKNNFDSPFEFHVIVTPQYKELALVALRPNVIIEDRLSTLEAYRDHAFGSDDAKLILVDRPYNRLGSDVGIIRVENTTAALKEALNA